MVTLKVNGETVSSDVEEDTPLLWVLREQLGLTGTKYGCGIAQCGACTVHIDGQAVRSCVYPAAALSGEEEITTIEGLSDDASHPVQEAWAELDIPQCGYCQPGMIMAGCWPLGRKPQPFRKKISTLRSRISVGAARWRGCAKVFISPYRRLKGSGP